MFFDHGNHGGALVGLLLHLFGAPGEAVWIGFAVGWIMTAYPDLAPIVQSSAWSIRLRTENDLGEVRTLFKALLCYRWAVYLMYHEPEPSGPKFIRWNPFFALHRLADLPAHTPRAKTDRTYQIVVYVLTSLAGWIALGALILLRSLP